MTERQEEFKEPEARVLVHAEALNDCPLCVVPAQSEARWLVSGLRSGEQSAGMPHQAMPWTRWRRRPTTRRRRPR